MRLFAQSDVAVHCEGPCFAMLMIEAGHVAGQTIVSETLTITPHHDFQPTDMNGDRVQRGHVSGDVSFAYRAVIDVEPRAEITADLVQRDWADLPAAVVPYLMPSRFCPSDSFLRFANREFGRLAGGAKVLAIIDWLRLNLDYEHGVSDAETTAERTFVDRAGVCRDWTHLGITLSRAGGIPARAVSAYALHLDPPDFHAVFEVWLGDGWWLVDPTGLAPVAGLIRIAHGRDAADIAWLTTSGAVTTMAMTVSVVAIG